MAKIANGIAGSKTVGTGWRTSKRKFPSVNVVADYLVVFDPSEV